MYKRNQDIKSPVTIATNDKVLGDMLTEGAFGIPYKT